ncbi:MAG: cytochrome C554 [Candidatus Marinimicrobia bacterium]|nr:cytochrome C554 [Candidatus Neomarinimicrobiota bacterium]MCF7828483.1 cytochrome C554 [Candidatus Neomarinimicrobiota bacterium]MCF7881973.1 cytochrome C554 [Candidatus Neomarinimicrobiota bacterium]
MGKKFRAIGVFALSVFVLGSMVFAQDDAETDANQFKYVGAKKCMPCHMSPAKGAQYKQWMSSPHSNAYKTLGTEAAKEAAPEGIDNPQEAPECLKCHVTGYEASDDRKVEKYDMTEGVSCESCHGPGSDYWKMPVMMGISKGTMEAAVHGLEYPDEETCIQCHNDESPTFDGFNYEESYKKIAHPNPQNQG